MEFSQQVRIWEAALCKIVIVGLATIAALYLLSLAALFLMQRSLIYPTTAAGTPPSRHAFVGFEEAWLATSDGLALRAIYRPARPRHPTVVFFHGNGDSLLGGEIATRMLAAHGYGVLLPEYRGYGGNPGTPSEAGLCRDGRAALQWLAARGVPPHRTVLIGNSLGAGVAVQLATEAPVAGVALVSGFTSLADVAAQHLPLAPARLLLRDRYDNRGKVGRVTAPVLVLHGTADTLIPARHAVELAKAAPDGRTELMQGVGHELAYLPACQATILNWLQQLP